MRVVKLPPDLVHPLLAPYAHQIVRHGSVEGFGLPEPQRLVAEAFIALLGSERMPDEMRGYAETLNAALDVPTPPEALLGAIRDAHRAAQGVESARSGMACDIALSYLDLALDQIREFLRKS